MKKDIETQENVLEELRHTPMINANEIGVTVKNGLVTLSGMVDTYPQKIRIERAVKKVKGVRGIAEDIEVVLPLNHKKNDSEIAQAILHAIEWHSALQLDKVNILVEDGCVVIEGTADWDFQRKSVSQVASHIVGVKSVINNIKLSPVPSTDNIRNKMQAAFARNATIAAEKIEISIENSKVILSGIVNSWAEYEEAERTAWATPGVAKVENNLELFFEL